MDCCKDRLWPCSMCVSMVLTYHLECESRGTRRLPSCQGMRPHEWCPTPYEPHSRFHTADTQQLRLCATDMTPGYGSMSKTPMVCAWYEVYVENVSLDEQASATPKCAHLDDAQSPQPPLRCKHATSLGCYAADARPAWAGCGRCPPKCASAAFVPQPYTERGERRLGPCHTHVDCLRIAGLGRVLSATVAHNPHRCKQASAAQAQHYRAVARKPRLSTAVTTSLR